MKHYKFKVIRLETNEVIAQYETKREATAVRQVYQGQQPKAHILIVCA